MLFLICITSHYRHSVTQCFADDSRIMRVNATNEDKKCWVDCLKQRVAARGKIWITTTLWTTFHSHLPCTNNQRSKVILIPWTTRDTLVLLLALTSFGCNICQVHGSKARPKSDWVSVFSIPEVQRQYIDFVKIACSCSPPPGILLPCFES